MCGECLTSGRTTFGQGQNAGLARRIFADFRGNSKNVLADGDTHVAGQQFFFFKSFPRSKSAFRRLGHDWPKRAHRNASRISIAISPKTTIVDYL